MTIDADDRMPPDHISLFISTYAGMPGHPPHAGRHPILQPTSSGVPKTLSRSAGLSGSVAFTSK